jgi:hypothetical protein
MLMKEDRNMAIIPGEIITGRQRTAMITDLQTGILAEATQEITVPEVPVGVEHSQEETIQAAQVQAEAVAAISIAMPRDILRVTTVIQVVPEGAVMVVAANPIGEPAHQRKETILQEDIPHQGEEVPLGILPAAEAVLPADRFYKAVRKGGFYHLKIYFI